MFGAVTGAITVEGGVSIADVVVAVAEGADEEEQSELLEALTGLRSDNMAFDMIYY
jgi:hypothetical protein